jgi:hypothetical protein
LKKSGFTSFSVFGLANTGHGSVALQLSPDRRRAASGISALTQN